MCREGRREGGREKEKKKKKKQQTTDFNEYVEGAKVTVLFGSLGSSPSLICWSSPAALLTTVGRARTFRSLLFLPLRLIAIPNYTHTYTHSIVYVSPCCCCCCCCCCISRRNEERMIRFEMDKYCHLRGLSSTDWRSIRGCMALLFHHYPASSALSSVRRLIPRRRRRRRRSLLCCF